MGALGGVPTGVEGVWRVHTRQVKLVNERLPVRGEGCGSGEWRRPSLGAAPSMGDGGGSLAAVHVGGGRHGCEHGGVA